MSTLREPDEHADEYTRFRAAHDPVERQVDDRTWNDLNVDQLLCAIDRMHTTIGRQLLHFRLRCGRNAGSSDRLDRLVSLFASDQAARRFAEHALATMAPTTGQAYWRILAPGALPVRAWYVVFPVLTVVAIALLGAAFLWPAAGLALLAVILVGTVLRAATSKAAPTFLSAFGQVAPIMRAGRRLSANAAIHQAADGAEIAAALETLGSFRRVASWLARESVPSNEILGAIQETLNLLFMVNGNALYFGGRALARYASELSRVSVWVADVDVALNIAALRVDGRSWCVPVRTAAGTPTTVVRGWHPMLADPVPNSVTLTPGSGLIVTGSNMSGKSTLLRMIGACVVLGNALNRCPAESFTGPDCAVRSCIGRADDLAAGKSYYLAEVEAVLGLLRTAASGDASILLLDELFRGTNTIERLAAGEAVLRAMVVSANGAPGPAVVIATHDGELVSMLRDTYEPWHFQETIDESGLSFDYALCPGPATSRNAIALLEFQGAPHAVVEAARQRVRQLEARG